MSGVSEWVLNSSAVVEWARVGRNGRLAKIIQRMRIAQYAVVLVPSANLVLHVERICYNNCCTSSVIKYSSACVIALSHDSRTLNFTVAPRNPLKTAAINMWTKTVKVSKWCPTMLALIHQLHPVIVNFFEKTAFSPPGYTRWVLQKSYLTMLPEWNSKFDIPGKRAWQDHRLQELVR